MPPRRPVDCGPPRWRGCPQTWEGSRGLPCRGEGFEQLPRIDGSGSSARLGNSQRTPSPRDGICSRFGERSSKSLTGCSCITLQACSTSNVIGVGGQLG